MNLIWLCMHVLNGLGREFDNFVIAAQNREHPFTFAELNPRLLNHEQWLVAQHQDTQSMFDSQNPSAFYGKNNTGVTIFLGITRINTKVQGILRVPQI